MKKIITSENCLTSYVQSLTCNTPQVARLGISASLKISTGITRQIFFLTHTCDTGDIHLLVSNFKITNQLIKRIFWVLNTFDLPKKCNLQRTVTEVVPSPTSSSWTFDISTRILAAGLSTPMALRIVAPSFVTSTYNWWKKMLEQVWSGYPGVKFLQDTWIWEIKKPPTFLGLYLSERYWLPIFLITTKFPIENLVLLCIKLYISILLLQIQFLGWI